MPSSPSGSRWRVGGVGQRAHDRLARLGPALELRLPRVQRGAALGGRRRAARPVDDLVRRAHVAVQRVCGGTQLGGQPAGGEVVRRIVAEQHPPRRLVPLEKRRVHEGRCHRVNTVEALLRDRSVLYVTGKGGVGKTTVAAALGLAAARTGRRTIVCEVAEQDRMSRAFARHGVRPEQEVELAEDLWAITIDPTQALLEWLGKQAGGAAGRHPRALAHVPVLRRRRARREGADHDREGVGAGAERSAGTSTTGATTSSSSTRPPPATASGC